MVAARRPIGIAVLVLTLLATVTLGNLTAVAAPSGRTDVSVNASLSPPPPVLVTSSTPVNGSVDFGTAYASIEQVCYHVSVVDDLLDPDETWAVRFPGIISNHMGKYIETRTSESSYCVTPGFAPDEVNLFLDGREDFDLVAVTRSWGPSGPFKVSALRVQIIGEPVSQPAAPVTHTPTPTATATPVASLPSLSAANVWVAEGDSGQVDAVFTVSLSAPSSAEVTVQFATFDLGDSAVGGTSCGPGDDYIHRAAGLVFKPGETTQSSSIALCGDTTVEPDEYLHVGLSQPGNATIADEGAFIAITDDDAAEDPLPAITPTSTATATPTPTATPTRTSAPPSRDPFGDRPAAPSNLRSGTVTTSSIQVLWNDNATDETSYMLYHKPANSSSAWTPVTLPAGTTSWTLSGLSAGATVEFLVRACRGRDYCSTYPPALRVGAEPPPTDTPLLRVLASTNNSLRVGWNDVAGERNYQLAYAPLGAGEQWRYQILGANATSHLITGVTPGRVYGVFLRACTLGGCSHWSAGELVLANLAPSNLRAGPAAPTSINLQWNDNSTAETGFQVAHRSAGSTEWRYASTGANATAWEQTGLAAGTRYEFLVRACSDQGCTAWSNTLTAATR